MSYYKILIVSATEYEINPIKRELTFVSVKNNTLSEYKYKTLKTDILITGIGISFTTYHLTKTLIENNYDFIINIGICGSFKKDITIGSVLNIIQDEFGDLGITDKNDFHTLFEENLIKKDYFPFKKGILLNNLKKELRSKITKVKGITVNSASGNSDQINIRVKKYNPDVESMEGAAFFFVCLNENVPFIQIRSV